MYTRNTFTIVAALHGASFNPWLQEIELFRGFHQSKTPIQVPIQGSLHYPHSWP